MIKQLCLVVLIILNFVACSNDDNLVHERYTGTVTAIKNGEEWNALVYFEMGISNPHSFVFGAHVYNNKGLLRETFGVRRILPIFDIQEITSTDNQNNFGLLSADYFTIIDGDALENIYDLDTTATNNFIQIKNYNSSKAEIKGIFNVSLILTRDSNDSGTPPPQTLEFINGEFTVKVQREWFE